jgi:two-component system sensor histidine kinase RegB
MGPTDQEVLRLNLGWLVRLRTWAIVGQLATMLLAWAALGVALPWPWLGSILAVEVGTNVAAGLLAARVRRWWLAGLVALDIVLLTGLLALTGGPSNPFNFLYLVSLTLAAVMLRPREVWALTALAAAAFGALFFGDVHEMHMRLMELHLRGMWVAFTVAAVFIVYFVGRVTRALAVREEQLARARERTARSERLAALAGLAAGAAHELATPLGTVALAAKELARALELDRPRGELIEDARLIRSQVERCRQILDRMSLDAGRSAGEALGTLTAGELLEAALARRPDRDRFVVRVDDASARMRLRGFRSALIDALGNILDNAARAAPAPVEVTLEATGPGLRIRVRDAGPGMSPEVLAAAGEPFFTTRAPGEGMGLGLFLTRSVLEAHGGALTLESPPGGGTVATLVIRGGDGSADDPAGR